jgi:predicted dehydrogenase
LGLLVPGWLFNACTSRPIRKELVDQFRITALCDQEREKAQVWANKLGLSEGDVYTDYRELARREDLQVIDIMSRSNLTTR